MLKPIRGRVAIEINESDFGRVVIPTPNGDLVLQIDTAFEKAHHQTQYNKVVAVAENVHHIKPGMMVFHSYMIFQKELNLEKNIYHAPAEHIWGTTEEMFEDNVMMEPIFTKKECVVGKIGIDARVVEVDDQLTNKSLVVLGKHKGKEMYCTNLAFNRIVGFNRHIYVSKEKQLICDKDLNPVEGKLLVIPDSDELETRASGIIAAKNVNRKGNTGIVYKSGVGSINEQESIVYERFYQITIDGTVYHSVLEKDVSAVLTP